jgi:hypothetical protein
LGLRQRTSPVVRLDGFAIPSQADREKSSWAPKYASDIGAINLIFESERVPRRVIPAGGQIAMIGLVRPDSGKEFVSKYLCEFSPD